jgi:hypothetical protein
MLKSASWMAKSQMENGKEPFDMEPRARYGFSTQGMNYHLFGDKYLEVPNEPEAIVVQYYLGADAPAQAKITVSDSTGHTVRQLDGPAKKGLTRALVNLGGGGGRGRGAATPALAVGDYTVTVEVAGVNLTKSARVRARIGG